MREIKFRVWDRTTKTMRGTITPLDADFENPAWFGGNLEFGQYTGLKDKNGVEIYEGDILECEDSNSDYPTVAKVYWDEEYGRWNADEWDAPASETCEYELWAILEEYMFVTVRGNIYENPELLTTNP